jgi:hypothetical protein
MAMHFQKNPMSRAFRRRSKVVALLTAASLLTFHFTTDASSAAPTSATVSVHPDTSIAGRATPTMIGLSFEKYALNAPTFGADLTTYLKMAGPGLLRIGANGQDKTFWTSRGETAPDWSIDTITPESYQRLAKVAHDSGWRVILGVNLKHPDPARVTDEVATAKRLLGSDLAGIAIGNEPEQYGVTPQQYVTDFNSLVAAVRSADADVPIIGGDVQKGGDVQNALIEDQKQRHDLSAWTRHYYPTNACGTTRTSIAALLTPSTLNGTATAAASYVAQGDALGVSTYISETNTVACGGQAGVSDVYASALWATASTLSASSAGIDSFDLHGSVGHCGGTATGDNFYTLFCAPTDDDYNAGRLVAQPEFYGVLAARQAGYGQFVKVDNGVSDHLRIFAVNRGGRMSVVVVNIDDPSKAAPIDLRLELGATFDRARRVDLKTTSPDGLAAKDGITLGGDSIDDGVFTPSSLALPVSGQSVDLRVAPGTASVLKLS